ncbi:MAG: ABC transporter C-terminal domain-containing protein, partial [bacterium]
ELVDQERRAEASTVTKEPPKRDPAARPKKTGLTFLERKEWDEMEARILTAEDEVARLQAELDDPAVATDHEKLHAAFEAHRAAQATSSALYARWEELEQKRLGE